MWIDKSDTPEMLLLKTIRQTMINITYGTISPGPVLRYTPINIKYLPLNSKIKNN